MGWGTHIVPARDTPERAVTAPAFRVELAVDAQDVSARFHGDLTIDAEETLAVAFRDLVFPARARLTVDFSGVPHVNSSGIAALLGILIRARGKTQAIAFVGLNKHLDKIFRMTGFEALVELETPS